VAHVEKRGPRKYRARYRDPSGAERSQTFTTRERADDFLTEIEHAKRVGGYVDPADGRATFGEYAESWLAKQVFRPSSMERVTSNVETHMLPAFKHRQMASIRPTDVQTWVKKLSETLAPRTVRVVYGQLTWIFNAAVVDRVIAATPCPPRQIKLPMWVVGGNKP
jgi:hypothetical protein